MEKSSPSRRPWRFVKSGLLLPEKQLQLGVGNLGIVLQPNDPAGTYEIHAKVSDRVKGVVLELKTKFSVNN